MIRLLAALCLVGATVLSSAMATAQTAVGSGSKSVGLEPGASQARGAVDGEVPAELLDKIRAVLATEQGVSAADVKVVTAQSVNWPNGALGCPKPGRMY